MPPVAAAASPPPATATPSHAGAASPRRSFRAARDGRKRPHPLPPRRPPPPLPRRSHLAAASPIPAHRRCLPFVSPRLAAASLIPSRRRLPDSPRRALHLASPARRTDLVMSNSRKRMDQSSPASPSRPVLVMSHSGNRLDQPAAPGHSVLAMSSYVKHVTGRHNDTDLHLAVQHGDLDAVHQIIGEIDSQMTGSRGRRQAHTALTDDILLSILERVDIATAARTSALSKRWRNLPWLLTELDLNVRHFLPAPYPDHIEPRHMRRAMKSLTRATRSFLASRDSKRTARLSLQLYMTGSGRRDIALLVRDAIDREMVKELEVAIIDEKKPRDCKNEDMLRQAQRALDFFSAYPSVLCCLTTLCLQNVRFATWG